jgi:hypothetical protein
MNQESLYLTRLCGDTRLELLTLQNAAMHAGHLGRPHEALQLADSVLDGPYRLTSRVRALFLTRRARALAQGGDESALRMFAEVRSLYLDGPGDDDPPWAWWVDDRELAWHEAMAHQDLGLHGAAVALFEESVAATPPSQIRSQYLHRAHLLVGQIAVRTWADASATMNELQSFTGDVASTRSATLLRGALGAMPQIGAPRHVDEQARQLSVALDRGQV